MNTCTPGAFGVGLHTYFLTSQISCQKLIFNITEIQYNGDIDDAESYPIRYEQIRK